MKEYGGMDRHFLTLELAGSEWLASRPGRFTPGERPRYPLDRRLGGPQSRSGRRGEEKIVAPTGTQTRLLGHPASRYTDYAIPACFPLGCSFVYSDLRILDIIVFYLFKFIFRTSLLYELS
jgi:hypothetical protein